MLRAKTIISKKCIMKLLSKLSESNYLVIILIAFSVTFELSADDFTRLTPYVGTVDVAAIQDRLQNAPSESALTAGGSGIVIDLPKPGGGIFRVAAAESLIADQSVYDRYPGFMTYSLQGVDDPSISGRLTVSSNGVEGYVLTPEGAVYIQPQSIGSSAHLIYYSQPGDFPHLSGDAIKHDGHFHGPDTALPQNLTAAYNIGAQRREFRMHVIADKEYSVAVCGGTPNRACVEMAIMTALNSMNAFYIRDMAVKLNMTSNTTIYLTGNPAGFAAGGGVNSPSWHDESMAHHLFMETNTTSHNGGTGTDNSTVPRNSYDVGHLFSARVAAGTGGGGVAFLSSVCSDVPNGSSGPFKAGGGSAIPNPQGTSWVNLLAHEFTHQFNADHTWSGNSLNCTEGQFGAVASVEPGGGSTIVSYSDICGDDNIPNLGDIDYYHTISIKEVDDYIESGGVTCETNVASGNSVPVPSTSTSGCTPNYNIPTRTPFEIVGSATDANDPSGQLTYTWEQVNKSGVRFDPIDGPTMTNGSSDLFPIVRSFFPSSSSARTIPQISTILSGNYNGDTQNAATLTQGNWQGELLPEVAGTLTLRLTVRDNNAAAGGVEFADASINVVNTGAPFAVTSPNSGGENTTAGVPFSATWNVAGTTAAPISCANVEIKLSTDGGNTFPTSLGTFTNNGTAMVTIPGATSATSTARLRVQCGNDCFNFFDISNANFNIAAGAPAACSISAITTSSLSACNDNGTPTNPADDTFTANITVTYANPPGTGNLVLSGDGTASVAVGSLGSTTSHTFTGVTMSADGSAISLTATFSADTPCTLTNNNAGTAPASCCNVTTADAGADDNVCSLMTTLDGNTPTTGTGTWTFTGPGNATFNTGANVPNTTVTVDAYGSYTFTWTITNSPCTPSADNVVIGFFENPTVANANLDQNVCALTTVLAANPPTVGTGTWTASGPGNATFNTGASVPNTMVTVDAAGTYTFTWTISNAPCTASQDTVDVTFAANPTTANAGADQNNCALTATLAGNTPAIGTGMWTGTGPGSITFNGGATNPGTTVTFGTPGTYTLTWTISNAPCTNSTDDVTITANGSLTTANAGSDQTLCVTSTTLAGNNPTTGTGQWSLIGGSGTISDVNDRNSQVTNLGFGTNTFRWTISGPSCPDSTDDVTITVGGITNLAAGTQTACITTSNAYTQEIIVTYSDIPAGSGLLDVNGQTFTATMSPQTVNLINLDADSIPVNVTASFVGDGNCMFSANALFTAPPACDPANVTSVGIDGSGNLVINDTATGGRNNVLTIDFDPGPPPVLIITDTGSTLTATTGNSTQDNPNTSRIPLSDFSGNIIINSGNGNDTLTIDFTNGNPIPTGGLSFDGGIGSDNLVTTGGTFVSGTYVANGNSSGILTYDGTMITFTGLEPVTDNSNITNRVFTVSIPGNQQIKVTDAGNPGNGMSKIDSNGTGAFEEITFSNPTGSLTINAGDGADTVTVMSVDNGLTVPVTLNGDDGDDTTFLAADVAAIAHFIVHGGNHTTGDTLVFDAQGSPAGNLSNSIFGLTFKTISYNGIETVNITNSSGTPTTVPTLGEWGLIILALTFLVLGAYTIKKRQLLAENG